MSGGNEVLMSLDAGPRATDVANNANENKQKTIEGKSLDTARD